MNDNFKNKPFRSRSIGIVTGLFIAFAGACFIQGMELIEKQTSLTGWTSSFKQYNVPLFYIYAAGAIITFIIRRRIVRNIYKDVENNLDD